MSSPRLPARQADMAPNTSLRVMGGEQQHESSYTLHMPWQTWSAMACTD